MLNVSVRTSRLTLLNLNRSFMWNGRVDVMVLSAQILCFGESSRVLLGTKALYLPRCLSIHCLTSFIFSIFSNYVAKVCGH